MSNLCNVFVFLPSANEVSEGSVFTPGGGGGCPGPGPRGCPGPGPRGIQAQAWEVQTRPGGVSQQALRQIPPLPADGYCWNAFLFVMFSVVFVSHSVQRGEVSPV